MIKTLSPYYINVPFVSPLTGATAITYTINLFIWNGLKNAVPALPQYKITKSNPTTSTGTDKVNIARLVNDFLDFKPTKSTTTELIDGSNQVWLRTEIIYKTANTSDNNVRQLPNIELAVKGYGYGIEGENPQIPANKILMPLIDYKVNRNGFFNVPILIEQPPDGSVLVLNEVNFTSPDLFEFVFTSGFSPLQVYWQIKRQGQDNFTTGGLFSGVTSPQNIEVEVDVLTTIEFRIFAVNETTGNIIYSNVISVNV